MTKILLGILMGAGLAFSILALIEKNEQKKIDDWEKWRGRKE